MKKALMAMVAGFALVGLGTAAHADDNSPMGSSTMKKDMTHSNADMPSMSNELTGKVVKTDANTVWIEYSGAVVPLKVDANTHFEGASIKRARDLKEGEQIRASFTVNNRTDNLARTISLSSATGGSGLDTTKPSDTPATPDDNPKSY
jgi:hypothetical protein